MFVFFNILPMNLFIEKDNLIFFKCEVEGIS